MREVLEYYLKNCYQAMIHHDELSFEFRNYFVVYSFEKENDISDEEDYSYNFIDSIVDINRLFEKHNRFISLTIKGYEYLGLREDMVEGRSITNEMYVLIKKINSYRKGLLCTFYTDIDFGDEMCNTAGDYLFAIKINQDCWWNLEFAKHIRKFFNSIKIKVPDFYTIFFRKNVSIKDSKIVPILSTNTKVRRLGYFKILGKFLDENKKVSTISINKKFENYCKKYKPLLEENLFKKGIISETKTGISAKPYINTANDLGFLNKINNIFYSGKLFKVYQVLQKEFISSTNIFELNDFDKVFFLECVLKNDYFYFSNLLELLFIEEKITYASLIEKFQVQLIIRLEDYKKSTAFEDRKVLNSLDIILNRIKKWEKADVYLEHLIMPRLNWMLDLRIIVKVDNEYLITEAGLKLFKHLSIWDDINTNKIISPNSFLDRFMIHLYDDCYNNGKIQNPKDKDLILEKMYEYIEDSFELFKTLAPNRVTASQAANYTKYKLYFNNKIKVGYLFILGKLSEKEQDKFIFKYQEQYQDGYIQKKN